MASSLRLREAAWKSELIDVRYRRDSHETTAGAIVASITGGSDDRLDCASGA